MRLRDPRDKLQKEIDAELCFLRGQLAQESGFRSRTAPVLADAVSESSIISARLDAVLSSASWRSASWLRALLDAAKLAPKKIIGSIIAPKKPVQAASGPLRVLMVGHALDLTGAPHSQFEMAIGLKRRKLADPVILSTADGPLKHWYESSDIEVRVVDPPLANIGSLLDYRRRIAAIGELFSKLQISVVHANTLQTFWAVDAAASAGLPAIWNVRESESWQTYFDWLPRALRGRAYACFENAWRVVFVSNATRQAWAPIERNDNFTVVHNGLDLRAFDDRLSELDRGQARRRIAAQHADVVIVLVGTVTERKGQLDLVRAAALLPAELAKRCQIYMVGDRPSPYSDQLHREAAELPSCWGNRLHTVPETDAVPAYLRAADIAVCSSRIESYPRVILEEMAASLPIVTTPVFGIVEQVRAGENALIYQPEDVSELAGALTRLIKSPDLRDRMGERSRILLQQLTSYEQMLEQYAALFYEACGKQTPKRDTPCAGS